MTIYQRNIFDQDSFLKRGLNSLFSNSLSDFVSLWRIIQDSRVFQRFTRYWIYFFIPISVYGQSRVGDWNSYTSTLEIRKAIEVGNQIVCATSGGIIIFDRVSKTFETLTNIDGLAETDISTLEMDSNSHLWVGSSSPRGIVQIYDLENRRSIKTFDLDLTEIADIETTDSTVFVAYSRGLDWGILEFILKDNEFIYRQIYNPSEERLEFISNIVVIGDSLFAATNRGLFVGDYQKYILNYPQNWNLFPDLGNQPINHMKTTDMGLLIIADSTNILSYGDSLKLISDKYTGSLPLLDVIITRNNTLYAINRIRLFRFNEDGTVQTQRLVYARVHSLHLLSDDNLLLATDRGLVFWNRITEEFQRFIPNSPVSNIYTALTILDDGRLIAVGKKGVSILSEFGWYNLVPSMEISSFHDFLPEDYSYFVADTAQYKSNRVWSVVHRDDNWIFFSIQGILPSKNSLGNPIGGGVVGFDLNDPSNYVVYDTSNGIDYWDEKGYMNVRGLFIDNDQNLWVSNFAAGDLDKKITVIRPDGTWFHVPQTGLLSSQKLYNPTDIWVLDNKWVMVGGSQDHAHPGGLFIADIVDKTDFASAEWRAFFEKDGLADPTVWSFTITEPNVIWVLTSGGVQRLTFNSNYTTMTPYFFTFFPSVPFAEGSKLTMDSRNNLWVSSITDGLYVLLENSTPWPDWEGFRHDNSYLLSDDVTAVAIDDERGIAYIATSKGINSLKIPFAKARTSFNNVITYPSPYRIPSNQPMVIDGLMDNSSIKIMTLAGRVIREIKSTSASVQGYQAFWDGKVEDTGEYVGTGIYLVTIYSESGESHVTKIAVIRE